MGDVLDLEEMVGWREKVEKIRKVKASGSIYVTDEECGKGEGWLSKLKGFLYGLKKRSS